MEEQNRGSQLSERSEEQAQDYDSFLYKFQQQIIDAWKPVPHTSSNIILYIILTTICLGLGLALVLTAPGYPEVYLRYDDICAPSSSASDNSFATAPCRLTFTISETLPAPVYLYYGFKGFFQNHRRYLKFVSYPQLQSGDPWADDADDDCGDYYTNTQTYPGANSVAGSALTGSDPAFPCGTIGRMYYLLREEIRGWRLWDSSGNQITVSQSGVAWPSDKHRFVNSAANQRPFDVTEQTFLVWFRPAARSTFYKLNGVVHSQLPAGSYTVTFLNRVESTWGQKWFSVSKSNFVGNKDLFLGIAFLVLGGACLILLIVFIAKWIAQKRNIQAKLE